MKITRNDGKILTFSGVPGSFRWMLFAAAIGAGITLFCAYMIWQQWSDRGFSFSLIPLGAGVLFGLLFLAFGASQLMARERLILDRQIGRGSYTSNSPMVVTAKPFDFKLENIAEVRLIHRVEYRDSGEAGTHARHRAEIWRLDLRTSSPRRTVMIEESQNGREARVRKAADRLCEFLQVDLVEDIDSNPQNK